MKSSASVEPVLARSGTAPSSTPSVAGLEQALELALRLADGAWHSGEILAADYGLTRAGLAGRMARLAELGLEVEALAGRGYRLPAWEPLEAARLREALPRTHVTVSGVVDSTSTRLMDAPAGDDPHLWLAEFQTAGRGRRGRGWRAIPGQGLCLSLATGFPSWPVDLTWLPLALGVALARALAPRLLTPPRIKWPNDLWLAGEKAGGLLVETRAEAGGPCRVVAGVGLNLFSPKSAAAGSASERLALPAIDQPWTTLAEHGWKTGPAGGPRHDLVLAIATAWQEVLNAFAQGEGRAWTLAHWARYDALAGQPVRVLAEGVEAWEGTAGGLAADGALLVRRGDGRVEAVRAGEVSLRPIGAPDMATSSMGARQA